MEEKRPGQHPDEELTEPARGDVVNMSSNPSDKSPTAMERELLRRARRQADADRAKMRYTGHGDHKGEEGF
jgi:hypothetical protein